MSFDAANGAGHGFAPGDLIRAQRVNMEAVQSGSGAIL